VTNISRSNVPSDQASHCCEGGYDSRSVVDEDHQIEKLPFRKHSTSVIASTKQHKATSSIDQNASQNILSFSSANGNDFSQNFNQQSKCNYKLEDDTKKPRDSGVGRCPEKKPATADPRAEKKHSTTLRAPRAFPAIQGLNSSIFLTKVSGMASLHC